MEFVIGGYFLVQGAQRKKWMSKDLIPATFWTVDTSICEVFPDSWVFPWGSDKLSRDARFFRDLLEMSEGEFSAMQAQFDRFLESGQFGFPNVFFGVDLAREFCARCLDHLPDIKLISVALPEKHWAEFVEKFTPQENIGESGVRKKLRRREMVGSDVGHRGFEVLGFGGARFCSFVSNSLETHYHTALRITLNAHGLIDSYDDAIRAVDYTRLDETGAEPVFWQPWLVSEYPLDA